LNPDTESCFINSFWDRLPDRVAINADLQIEYLEKFNGQLGRQGEKKFLEVKEAEATEQHKSIIRVLRLLERGM